MTRDSSARLAEVADRLRARIGWTISSPLTPIDAERVRRWVEATEDSSSQWAAEVPPVLLATLRPWVSDDSFPEAAEIGGQWLNGGDHYRFLRPVRVGERIRATLRLAGVEQKRGASGPFLLLSTETTFETDEGELVCRIDGSLIRR